MNRAASSAIGDVDLIIFVVDGTHWNADDEMVLNKLRNAKAPVVLAINKSLTMLRIKMIIAIYYRFRQQV